MNTTSSLEIANISREVKMLFNDMPFEKKFNEPDGQWFPISEEAARMVLERWFVDVDLAIQTLSEGQMLRTPFSFYRRRPSTARVGEAQ